MRAGWLNVAIGLLNSAEPRRATWIWVIVGCVIFWAVLLPWAL
jgi:hypothetical protein